jgi:hypothetical protein
MPKICPASAVPMTMQPAMPSRSAGALFGFDTEVGLILAWSGIAAEPLAAESLLGLAAIYESIRALRTNRRFVFSNAGYTPCRGSGRARPAFSQLPETRWADSPSKQMNRGPRPAAAQKFCSDLAFMLLSTSAQKGALGLLISWCVAVACAQTRIGTAQAPAPAPHSGVTLTVVDENGVAVPTAQITIEQPGKPPLELRTDYAGRCSYRLQGNAPYTILAAKPNFYQAQEGNVDPSSTSVRIAMAHVQIVKEQVNVTASTPGIDTQQVSDNHIMNMPEIVNIPYQTSRDIRYILPFYPNIVSDSLEQVHVSGSDTWQTLDMIDGFDVRTPVEGTLDMRVSADAVRSVDEETTRYPVQYGRATGGVIAFTTGMGDNKFRFNATNFFLPGFRMVNGIHFDKYVPRFTFSGPVVKNRAWWFDGLEMNYESNYTAGLPAGAPDTAPLIRGSNLLKVQINVKPNNIVTAGLLFNELHTQYSGFSTLTPRPSTTKQNIIASLPYIRDQWSFGKGALLDIGVGEMRFRDGWEPHGNPADTPYTFTPELTQGSYFQSLTGRSQRQEGTADLYLPPRRWGGEHDLRLGLDLDRVTYNQNQVRAPVNYLREDGTLIRQSTFPQQPAFTMHDDEVGAYLDDRWQPFSATGGGLLIEPGLRFDWDTIVRRPMFGPRIAAVYAPPHARHTTKISAGIGLYYDDTHLSYIMQPYTGIRYDTYYAADGKTPTGPPQETDFTKQDRLLHDPRAVNWSVAVERALPWSLYGGVSFIGKRTTDLFTFANQSGPAALAGNYLLTNARTDHYHAEGMELRKLFKNGYTLYVSYMHSAATTNAALDYLPTPTEFGPQPGGLYGLPTPSPLGPQQPGPQPWNAPNRWTSWGWLPFDVPGIRWFQKNWDFVYAFKWQSGLPYTAVNAAGQVVGAAGGYHFPAYVNFAPGLEWRFHFHGQYWGLRGAMENATDSFDPLVVNNNFASPQFGTFSDQLGRALTARIRLIR